MVIKVARPVSAGTNRDVLRQARLLTALGAGIGVRVPAVVRVRSAATRGLLADVRDVVRAGFE